jgi:transposase
MTTVSVLTSPERRRRWTSVEKLRIVNDCESSGLSVTEFARQRDIHANLIHSWRRQARTGLLLRTSPGEARFMPVSIVAGADPTPTAVCRAKELPIIEVVLRNGRVLRLGESVAPADAARFADALEGCR